MMSEKAIEIKSIDERKRNVMIIGAVVGAFIGLAAAYLFVQQSEVSGKEPSIDAGEGVRMGLLVLGLLREISNLGERKGKAKR